ncbi:MAG: N-acetylmuramic acid 6-phosphate etherase [Meiothermus sp.]|uniref:N-acetylmuramic acid 6-phosphate etherase n=1 Tax=Meiothermus sp. TaxID=1955249 RepID=UPI0025E5C808|nr:N-acetylmuramic acid 6-phosphate etherase [Meiothermus sp.]MCS7068464.1 N-acetylmuramic acid 6-phosphate etherase [Meiothermus sp.]MDW8425091.1 N-acetylmuramic acid 6-phosphate etherase [Meiothermus sp.]
MSKLLATEQISEAHRDLETRTPLEVVQALVNDQTLAVAAVQRAAPQLAEAVERAAERMHAGGRLIYVGAGTSGRLGQLDASELPPTFSWPPERALACIAGGPEALWQAVEGAEDDYEAGRRDLLALHPTPSDVVIGIAASGTTPYPLGAVAAAREAGALTIGLANNPETPLVQQSQLGIVLDTGPEVISGSTRLKAGTAQKIALNAFSSALMVRLGKVYGNLMVDVQATNAKLLARAVRLTVAATGAPEEEARAALERSGYRVKTAIVMLKKNLDAEAAQALLDRVGGNVRMALGG